MQVILKLIVLVLFSTQCLASHEPNLNKITPDTTWGKRADTITIDIASIPEPPLSKTGKSFVTENKFGFDMFKSETTWVVEDFLRDVKPNMVVMDSGAGYGALSRQALEKGAIVICNDISDKQLNYNLKHISANEKTRLYLNNKDVRQLQLKENSLDLVMFHRVLHFLKGKEIEKILVNSYKWLKPGGKIYIVMLSKDHVLYRDKIQYDETKKWPGESSVNVKKHLPKQAYSMKSEALHVISTETLVKRLEEAGFKIEKADYASLKSLGQESNRDGKEAVGIIAVKK